MMFFFNFYLDDILSEISILIKPKRLTACLLLLEEWGERDDAALKLLSYLQIEGVGV